MEILIIILEKTIYTNVGETFTVPCQNKTPGSFFGIVWKSTAKKYNAELYTYLTVKGYNIDETIVERSRLVKDTYLQIDKAKLSDSGVYECNLLYEPPSKRIHAMMASKVTVVVFGMSFNLSTCYSLSWNFKPTKDREVCSPREDGWVS